MTGESSGLLYLLQKNDSSSYQCMSLINHEICGRYFVNQATSWLGMIGFRFGISSGFQNKSAHVSEFRLTDKDLGSC